MDGPNDIHKLRLNEIIGGNKTMKLSEEYYMCEDYLKNLQDEREDKK